MTARKARELSGKTLVVAKSVEGRGVSPFDDTTRVSETAELGFFCASMSCLDAIMAVYAEESGLRTALHRPLPHTEERFRTGE